MVKLQGSFLRLILTSSHSHPFFRNLVPSLPQNDNGQFSHSDCRKVMLLCSQDCLVPLAVISGKGREMDWLNGTLGCYGNLPTPNLPTLCQCRCWNSPCEISSSPFLYVGSTNTHRALDPGCVPTTQNVKLAGRKKSPSSLYIYGLSFSLLSTF